MKFAKIHGLEGLGQKREFVELVWDAVKKRNPEA